MGIRNTTPSDGRNPPIFKLFMSQTSIHDASDDPRDGVTVNAAPTDKPATDPAWFVESMRGTRYIREVNGRQYNAQNTTYFLPAGE